MSRNLIYFLLLLCYFLTFRYVGTRGTYSSLNSDYLNIQKRIIAQHGSGKPGSWFQFSTSVLKPLNVVRKFEPQQRKNEVSTVEAAFPFVFMYLYIRP